MTRSLLGLAAAVAVSACQGAADRFPAAPSATATAPDEPASAAADLDDDDEPGALSAIAGGLDPLTVLRGVLAGLSEPGRYEAPKEGPACATGCGRITAVVELDGAIVEQPTVSLTGGGGGTALRDVTAGLRALAADDGVAGVVVRVGTLEVSLPDAMELTAAMAEVRAAGKRLACHAEGASNAGYLVLAACEQIGLAPLGTIVLSGPAAMPIHLRPLLDRLGVTADFLHVGAFKGAAEPLTRDEPSPEMRETLGAILDRRYQTLVETVARARGLAAEEVKAAIDIALLPDAMALARKLVDVVEPFEAFVERISDGAWKQRDLEVDDGQGLAQVMRFLGMAAPDVPAAPHVALVYALGDIVDGGGEGPLGARAEIAAHTLVPALRALAADASVAAVVLRIDSGGGSALASELIWQEVSALAAKKPVVASMSDVAASGGYYIAAPATKIYAQPDTLTGSIGVVGGKIAPGGALEKAGVRTFPMGRGARATMFASLGPWSADEKAAVQASMEATYQTFVARVAAGRKKAVDEVLPIAQGRVWVGTDALRLGLVDELGGLDAALAEATRLGNVASGVPLEVYPGAATLRDVVGSIGDVRMGLVETLAAGLPAAVATTLRGQWAQLLRFEHTPIQTVAILPVVR